MNNYIDEDDLLASDSEFVPIEGSADGSGSGTGAAPSSRVQPEEFLYAPHAMLLPPITRRHPSVACSRAVQELPPQTAQSVSSAASSHRMSSCGPLPPAAPPSHQQPVNPPVFFSPHHQQQSPTRGAAHQSSAGASRKTSPSREPDYDRLDGTLISSLLGTPKPKPKARHELIGVDPAFIETAAYRAKKGVGIVYDWKTQHAQNNALLKQRKEKQRLEKVIEAAKRQIQAREENDVAFQIWLQGKSQEKAVHRYERQRALVLQRIAHELMQEDPYEKVERETLWVDNFSSQYDSALKAPKIKGNQFALRPER